MRSFCVPRCRISEGAVNLRIIAWNSATVPLADYGMRMHNRLLVVSQRRARR
jgi:hypothetical protein